MLNTEAFRLLAGNPAAWDEEVRQPIGGSASLAALQRDQHERGRRSAELLPYQNGWCVRSPSSLDAHEWITEKRTALEAADAILLGIRWTGADPEKREFFVRRTVLRAALRDLAPQLLDSHPDERLAILRAITSLY